MGGSVEETQCTELSIDSYDPVLEITSPEDGAIVYVDHVTVSGEVDDPDASGGTAVNTVTITILTTEGDVVTFDAIDASDGMFTYEVEGLTLETESTTYNYITVSARDRSGQETGSETVAVLYTTDIEGEAIRTVEPDNGVSDEPVFDFIVATFLEAEICGYSKSTGIAFENYVALEKTASDAGEYWYGAEYSISEAKDGIAEAEYVTCELVNGVRYSTTLTLEYDSTAPVIEELFISNSDGKEPPSVIEQPLDPTIVVETDDPTLCKYSIDQDKGFSTGMTKFSDYDDGNYSTVHNHTITGLADQTSYTVYVACQNGAYATSDTTSLAFTIDSTAASGIYFIDPEVTGSRTFSVTIGTTRSAGYCYYGESDSDISTAMTETADNQWASSSVTVADDGIYRYYFSCGFADGEAVDYFDVIVDTTPPEIDWIEDGNVSYSNTTLSAAWSATDDLTEIVGYVYSIGSRAGYSDVLNWTNTTQDEAIAEHLILKNQSSYYWNVQAVNEVDYWSTIESSDGVFIDASGNGVDPDLNATNVGDVTYNTCSNGILDDDESDVDCGGACDVCAAGSVCEVDSDCSSVNCLDSICQESTCDDYIQNQGESDVDCGGNYCVGCEEGYACVYHRDCVSGYCEAKVCTAPSCYDNIENGDETGIDCGGSCDAICEDVDYQSIPPKTPADVDDQGLGVFGWIIIVVLIAGASVGGYYGYLYYMKKKGKKAMPLLDFGKRALPALQKPRLQQIRQTAQQRMQQIMAAKQHARAAKQQEREKVIGQFEQKKPLDVEKTKRASTEKQKIEEAIIVKKQKNTTSKTFSALDELIKKKNEKKR
jgi:hypothetical protein